MKGLLFAAIFGFSLGVTHAHTTPTKKETKSSFRRLQETIDEESDDTYYYGEDTPQFTLDYPYTQEITDELLVANNELILYKLFEFVSFDQTDEAFSYFSKAISVHTKEIFEDLRAILPYGCKPHPQNANKTVCSMEKLTQIAPVRLIMIVLSASEQATNAIENTPPLTPPPLSSANPSTPSAVPLGEVTVMGTSPNPTAASEDSPTAASECKDIPCIFRSIITDIIMEVIKAFLRQQVGNPLDIITSRLPGLPSLPNLPDLSNPLGSLPSSLGNPASSLSTPLANLPSTAGLSRIVSPFATSAAIEINAQAIAQVVSFMQAQAVEFHSHHKRLHQQLLEERSARTESEHSEGHDHHSQDSRPQEEHESHGQEEQESHSQEIHGQDNESHEEGEVQEEPKHHEESHSHEESVPHVSHEESS